jgi:polyvinyl alcohol dehydrogenase (cytochrome)
MLAAMFGLATGVFACVAEVDPLEPVRTSSALEGEDALQADIDSTSEQADLNGGGNASKGWPSAGHDLLNTRSNANERHISRNNASTLTPKWIFLTDGDVWATPAVAGDALYVPDAAGNLFAVDRRNGALLWKRKISDYTGVTNDLSRNTPAISGDRLILGNLGGRTAALAGASVFAVRRSTGELLWITKVEEHPAALVTQSPVVYRDSVYVGVSSLEEQYAATTPGYPCCSFKGSMLALDKNSGRILWKTSTQPGSETPGFAGGSVWGSTPVIDSKRNAVYVATGNNYTVPKEILECQLLGSPDGAKSCIDSVPGSSKNYFDSVLSLDLNSGAIKWARSMVPFDAWNVACVFAVMGNATNCTNPHGGDFDFAQGPTLYTVKPKGRTNADGTAAVDSLQAEGNNTNRGGSKQLLGAGQKSGMYWALNPDNGSVVWSTKVGPGGTLGGMEWGSATDGTRIYAAIANNAGQQWTLSDGTTTVSGFWSALDAASGRILWQTGGIPMVKSSNQGPVTVANGVVYAGTIDTAGTMYALDAANGKTLWTFASGGSVNSGVAVVDGVGYWGSGYGVRGIGLRPNNKLFAFVPRADCRQRNPCVPVAGSGGSGGAGGSAGSGGAAGGGGGPIPTTWSGIYATYLGPGTIGHCSGCHAGVGRNVPLDSAPVAYQSLQSVGQINGTGSPIGKRGMSRLTWLGGDMPPNGPTIAPDAEQAIIQWVAAGAPND